MAKPDCDDGWYKKSIELEAALGYANFTKLAQTVLRYVFCQIFGQGKRPRYAVINCSEIAARMKKPRQHVFRAIQELVASNVLVPVAGRDDTYRFIKDYDKWVMVARLKGSFHPTSVKRINPDEGADCLDAPTYSRQFADQTHADLSVINLDDRAVINLDDTSSGLITRAFPICHQSGLQNVIQIDDKSIPLDPPIRKESIEQHNTSRVETSRVAEDEFEPFMSPPPAESIPASRDADEESIHAYILKATRTDDYPTGRDDMADHAVGEFRHCAAGTIPPSRSAAPLRRRSPKAARLGTIPPR